MRAVIFGNGTPVTWLLESFGKANITILSVEQDKAGEGKDQETFEQSLNAKGIKLNQGSSFWKGKIDVIVVINYNKIIPMDAVENQLVLNIHMGLLPIYRGNNANAWAVINGAEKVGYTIHQVSAELDGGDIFYTYEYEIGNDDSYYKAKESIRKDICENAGSVIKQIVAREIKGISQAGAKFIYGVKLRPSDGHIRDWNISTRHLLRLAYVFGKPLGTGLKFTWKDNVFEAGCSVAVENFKSSIGVVGSIVNMGDDFIWVKTADTAIQFSEIKKDSHLVDVRREFRIGNRLPGKKNQ